jgi:hypothetical protein
MPLTTSVKLVEEASAYSSLRNSVPEILKHPALRWWLSDEFLFHAWMSPYRMLCMGVTSSFCEQPKKQQDADSGILHWLVVGRSLLQTIAVLPLVVQVLIHWITFAACFGRVCWFGDALWGCDGPLALLVILLVFTKTMRLRSFAQRSARWSVKKTY